MDLIFESTAEFEADLAQFPQKVRNQVIRKTNLLESLAQGHLPSQLCKPIQPKLLSGLASSLYVMRVDPYLRIILTVDRDPLFDQLTITLLQIVRHDDVEVEKAYKSWAKRLYQDDLATFEPIETLAV